MKISSCNHQSDSHIRRIKRQPPKTQYANKKFVREKLYEYRVSGKKGQT